MSTEQLKHLTGDQALQIDTLLADGVSFASLLAAARRIPRVYIAARYSRRPEAQSLGKILEDHGYLVCSRWCFGVETNHAMLPGLSPQAQDVRRERFATEDLEDVASADWVVSLMEVPRGNGRGGRHVEFGIAIGMNKRVSIIGPRETVFHHLPQVEHFNCVESFVRALEDAGGRAVPCLVDITNKSGDPPDTVKLVAGLLTPASRKLYYQDEDAPHAVEYVRSGNSWVDLVHEFHDVYDVPVLDKPAIVTERVDLRLSLIDEEFNTELKDALAAGDLVEVADALGDLIYVIIGAALEFGIPIDAVMREIHRSNLTKLTNTGTVIRREDGKVLKGPNFEPPDIAGLLAHLC